MGKTIEEEPKNKAEFPEATEFMRWILGEASKNRGLDQSGLAREAARRKIPRLSYNTINAMYQGTRKVKADNAINLARLSGVSVFESLYRSGHLTEAEYASFNGLDYISQDEWECLKLYRRLSDHDKGYMKAKLEDVAERNAPGAKRAGDDVTEAPG